MFCHQIIYESKSCCRMWFYMAESFLITHLANRRPPERWRKFAQTSLISQTVVMLLKNFFSSRLSRFSPTKKKNQVETHCVFLEEKLIQKFVISTSRWRQRFAKYWIYLGSISRPKLFRKQIRFAFSTTSITRITIITILQNRANDKPAMLHEKLS